MQVWNLLHAARWIHRTQKSRQKSPSGHHRTTLSGYIFTTKARIDNRKKNLLSSNISSAQYGELRPSSGWHRLTSLGYTCKFQLVSHRASVTARHLVVGVSQTLRCWTEGATYIRQGNHHVGHWPTFLVTNWTADQLNSCIISQVINLQDQSICNDLWICWTWQQSIELQIQIWIQVT